MIQFYNDWGLYKNAAPDYDTKNQSFIDLCSLYKHMGIKNHSMILALVDQRLKGVDPHDPSNDQTTVARIAFECKINHWYWLREVARVPGISGAEDGYLIANRGFIACWWSYFNHINTFLVQPRQTGKSLAFELLNVYLVGLRMKRSKIALLTRSEYLRTSTIEKIKAAADALPRALDFRIKSESNNNFSFTNKILNNRLDSYLPSKSEKTADALGRGFTIGTVQVDEGPFQDNSHITIPVLLSAAGAARVSAKKAGYPYGIIFTTTAGNRKTKEGEYMYNLQHDAAIWNETFFDCEDEEDLYKAVRANSRGKTLRGDGVLALNITLDHRQLGKTDDWLIETAEITGSTGDKLRMDYFNEWVMGSTLHPLSTALQDKINKGKKAVVYADRDKSSGYIINWYVDAKDIDRRMKSNTIVSVDSSDALGSDFIALTIDDAETGEVLGAGTFNYTSIHQWAKWLFLLLVRFPNTVLMLERKSSGMAILDTVVDLLIEVGESPSKRIFNMVVNNYKSKPEKFAELIGAVSAGNESEFYYRNKREFGFNTSGYGITSRSELYGNLKEAVTLIGHLINDNELRDELLGLVEKNNRIDHQENTCDDMVIAWLLSYWMKTKAQNLGYYGLDTLRILRNVPLERNQVDSDPDKAIRLEHQKSVKNTIDKLKEKFKDSNDDTYKLALQLRIKNLANSIEHESADNYYHPDQVLSDLREEKGLDKAAPYQEEIGTMSPWLL